MSEIRTERLVLREWRDEDFDPFAAMNGDRRVMEFFPAPLERSASDALAIRIQDGFEKHSFGLWAAEAPGVASFIGFIGLNVPNFTAFFTPCVEIGWRLAFNQWGKGYATEGARAAIDYGFKRAGLEEIVSFTSPLNVRSVRVMEKIGMQRKASEEFDHPALPVGHRLRRHVLYRIGSSKF